MSGFTRLSRRRLLQQSAGAVGLALLAGCRSGEAPPTFVMITASEPRRAGTMLSRYACTPRFSRPMEFRNPASVSQIRGAGFPARGSMVTVFETQPPSASGETKCFISRPWPKVPDAERKGFLS